MKLFQTRGLRTLFFFHETTWSGAPIQLFHLLFWLHGRGWPVAAAVPDFATPESGPIATRLSTLGIELFPVINLSLPPNLPALRDLCKRFDVVVANTLVMWAPVRAASDENVASIWYIHESLVARQLIEQNPEITRSLSLPQFLVMPTRRTAALYQTYVDRPINVVPYGIPPLKVDAAAEQSDRVSFLLLGSYEARKGQDVLLEAIRQLPVTDREGAHFRMAGREIEPLYFKELQRKAAGLPNFELGAALGHEEACAALAASDVVVCASRDETMPLVLLEAMSMGKAIITTDVGGIGEWLSDGVNALLVRSEDPAGLARALRRCLAEPELRARIGREARRSFRRSFPLARLGRTFRRLIGDAYRAGHS